MRADSTIRTDRYDPEGMRCPEFLLKCCETPGGQHRRDAEPAAGARQAPRPHRFDKDGHFGEVHSI
jgi:hypothetical protein